MPAIGARRQQPFDQVLVEVARTEVVISLEAQERRDQLARQDAVARLEPGRRRLGERHRQDYMLIALVETLDARHVGSIQAQLAVSGVLQDEQPLLLAEAPCQLHQVLPSPE